MIVGKVVWFDVTKGFGYINSSHLNSDIFVHYKDIFVEQGARTLFEGDVVTFSIGEYKNKQKAIDVKVIKRKNATGYQENWIPPVDNE